MQWEKIKEAFVKIKQDIYEISDEVSNLRDFSLSVYSEIKTLNWTLESLTNEIKSIKLMQEKISTQLNQIQTTSTHPSTVRQEIGGSNHQNLGVSIGNQGASISSGNTSPQPHLFHWKSRCSA